MSVAQDDRHFDSDYREEITLRDGTRVVLRLIRPQDKAILARGLTELSEQSRYLRFFSNKRELSNAELSYLTEIDQETHFALGAVTLDESRGLGVARFVVQADDVQVADPAIAVLDAAQGQGLGRLLFLRLVAAARERGVLVFRTEVLTENATMRKLLREMSRATMEEHDGDVVVVRMPLPVVDPCEPIHTSNARGAMYRLFALVAKGIVRVGRAIRQIAPRD